MTTNALQCHAMLLALSLAVIATPVMLIGNAKGSHLVWRIGQVMGVMAILVVLVGVFL